MCIIVNKQDRSYLNIRLPAQADELSVGMHSINKNDAITKNLSNIKNVLVKKPSTNSEKEKDIKSQSSSQESISNQLHNNSPPFKRNFHIKKKIPQSVSIQHIIREPSNKNILDEFNEKSNSEKINMNYLSYDTNLVNSTPYDDLLEVSMISYMNEKDLPKERSKHEIESNNSKFSPLFIVFLVCLSTKKHPIFKRTHIIGANALNESENYDRKNSLKEEIPKTKLLTASDKVSPTNLFKSNEKYHKNIDFNFNLEEVSLNIGHIERNSKVEKKSSSINLANMKENNEISQQITESQLLNQRFLKNDKNSNVSSQSQNLQIVKNNVFSLSHTSNLSDSNSKLTETNIKKRNDKESPKLSKLSNIQPMYFYYNKTLKKTKQTIDHDSHSRYETLESKRFTNKKQLEEENEHDFQIDHDSNSDLDAYEEMKMQTDKYLANNISKENNRFSVENKLSKADNDAINGNNILILSSS